MDTSSFGETLGLSGSITFDSTSIKFMSIDIRSCSIIFEDVKYIPDFILFLFDRSAPSGFQNWLLEKSIENRHSWKRYNV